MRRSPMRESRRPINRRSKKGEFYQHEYQAQTVLVKLRSGGLCEILEPHGCSRWATEHPHHRKLRGQGGSNDLVNLLDVCKAAHPVWIHRILPRQEAVRLGLIIPRDWIETPYQGAISEEVTW